jgi:hypothetical protein
MMNIEKTDLSIMSHVSSRIGNSELEVIVNEVTPGECQACTFDAVTSRVTGRVVWSPSLVRDLGKASLCCRRYSLARPDRNAALKSAEANT